MLSVVIVAKTYKLAKIKSSIIMEETKQKDSVTTNKVLNLKKEIYLEEE